MICEKKGIEVDVSRGISDTDVDSHAFMTRVRDIIEAVISNVSLSFGYKVSVDTLLPGKMLRTGFASRLIESGCESSDIEGFASACAATELVHTASLCHDDVIDNALLRRGGPTLWRTTTPSCSVLVGDLLFSEGVYLLSQTFDSRRVSFFISKIKEICATEIEQEIIWRGKQLDEAACMKIARGKTGPLFGFVGHVMGNGNTHLSSALEEAGYCIGTAYQLYDDLLDIGGSESLSGKTLNSDVRRGKITLPQLADNSPGLINSKISELCSFALESVRNWPHAQNGIGAFLKFDLQPALDRIQSGLKIV